MTASISHPVTRVGSPERIIAMGEGLASIPEKLLLAHSRGEVLFIAGAGISRASNLPDFRGLVVDVYEILDPAVHAVISKIPLPPAACFHWSPGFSGFNSQQEAELRRFINGDYDVVLGMLERRIDGEAHISSRVRQEIAKALRLPGTKPAPIHKALMRLADRGAASTIATTNFDLLLEDAAKAVRPVIQTYALGGIPRPGRGAEFSGVMHIHGALDRNPARTSDLIVSDHDFGEFYLRRRVVPDFIHDAARLYHIVLIGYSANDPPMRYLLNSVAADGKRFGDLRERFAFVGFDKNDPIEIEDWKGRGITPIPYDTANNHFALVGAMQKWAELSAINGKRDRADQEIRRIVRTERSAATEADRDLFDHIVRRADGKEKERISKLASQHKASHDWLDAITSIISEFSQEPRK